jgi:SPP1 family predicted phage head-tail adaptor
MANIGDFNRPVAIQQRSSTQDSVGQPIEAWSDISPPPIWADIRYPTGLKSLETISADAQTSISGVSIRIRFRSDITSAMRVVDGSTVYQIKNVKPNIGAKDYTDLVCEVVNGG